MKDSSRIGLEGEDLAALFLERKGYQIVRRRYRCRMGEIDLIAQKDGVVVFVEVKYRQGPDMSRALEAVNAAKQHKIRRTAAFFLSEMGREGRDDMACRYDVVGIIHYRNTTLFSHIENAF